jgi:hypothetical protein
MNRNRDIYFDRTEIGGSTRRWKRPFLRPTLFRPNKRVIVGRVGKPPGRLEKETVMEGTDAAGNRMFRSSTRKGI